MSTFEFSAMSLARCRVRVFFDVSDSTAGEAASRTRYRDKVKKKIDVHFITKHATDDIHHLRRQL